MGDLQITNIFQNSVELTERYAHCILNNLNAETELLFLNELGTFILHFDNTHKYHNAKDKIFNDFVNMIDSSTEELNCEDVILDFNEQISKIKEKFMNNTHSDNYKNYLKFISEQSARNDDEITTISQTINTIDPITKLPISDPVKNKQCGHVYEKTSILQLIDRNSKTKCPIAGCNADFVKKTDLIPDTALKRLLMNSCIESSPKKNLNL